MSGVYTYFKFSGRNLEKAISKMQRNNINLYKIRKTAADKLFFCCEIKDELKIFAIFEGSCYNIEKQRNGGYMYPLVFLKRNLGILFGLIIFLSCLIISNMFVYKIEITGSGSFYTSEINGILESNKIKSFSLFKELDFDIIEKEVLMLEGVNFVSAQRKGNRLIIDVRLGASDSVPKNRIFEDLKAPEKGEILNITIIRGTALAAVGDTVSAGQSLIGAYYYTLAEERKDTFVIGRIEMKCNTKILFECEFFDGSAKADALAYSKIILGEKEILSSSFTQIEKNSKKYIEVNCDYIEIINGG
jgi:sporulation protein YqfD